MAKAKGKNTASEDRKKDFEWIFIGGKQVRIKKPPTVEGIPYDEYADPIWLHQNGRII